MAENLHAVTGAFGYSGGYIARRLLAQGLEVMTVTNSLGRGHELQGQLRAVPFHFDRPDLLAQSLTGVRVLYNTYWVRFNHSSFTHSEAVSNTKTLFRAAARAGVERIVHVSISNPSRESTLEYFRGKAELEDDLRGLGISYAILRPTVLFGAEDILINNLCWLLRHFPLFAVFGSGEYRLQPIFVDDLAALAVEQGARSDNTVVEAIGPDTFTFQALLETLAAAMGRRARFVHVSPGFGALLGKIGGALLGDVLVTPEEIAGLMEERLYVPGAPAAGPTSLRQWARDNAPSLGKSYHSEIARRRDRGARYR